MTDRALSAIVLAAGAGTRMRSARPKPLHRLAGRSMLRYMIDSLADCRVTRIVVVVGHGADRMRQEIGSLPVDVDLEVVEQVRRDGTGDATAVGLTGLPAWDVDSEDDEDVIVLPGDMPLLRSTTIAEMVDRHRVDDAAATVLSAVLDDPSGYGRIIRSDDGHVLRIVEEADADPDEVAVDEINTAIYCFRRSLLAPALRRITPENAQGEYYLTDVIGVLHDAGHRVGAYIAADPSEAEGINDRVQLAAAEAELRRRTNRRWMESGVTLVDPATTYIDATVEIAPDVTIFPGTLLQGETVIGTGSEIGPGTRLVDCRIGDDVVVEQSNGRGATVPDGARVGPFSVLEPDDPAASGPHT